MNTELDNKTILKKLIAHMDNADIQQMLAYAAGYEAGKINKDSTENFSECSRENELDTQYI